MLVVEHQYLKVSNLFSQMTRDDTTQYGFKWTPPARAQPLCQYCAVIFQIKPFKSYLGIERCATAGDLIRASAKTLCAPCAAIQQH